MQQHTQSLNYWLANLLLGQVYFHLSVRRQDGEMLQTTRADDGGTGVPEAYVLNGKGRRALRGWELALLGVPQNATMAYQGQGRMMYTPAWLLD